MNCKAAGKIIILNGPSSAGKSSISKALQKRLDDCYLHFQQDAFWDMVPDNMEANSKNFPRLKYAIIECVHSILKYDHNVIMDTVNMPEHMGCLRSKLSEFEIFAVAVTADIDVLKQREIDRGDRITGLAESQHDIIHLNTDYDLKVDTTHLNADDSANLIFKAYSASQRGRGAYL